MDKEHYKTREWIVFLLVIMDLAFVVLSLWGAYYLRVESGLFDGILNSESGLTWRSYLGHFGFGLVLYGVFAIREGLFMKGQLLRMRIAPLKLLRVCFYWMLAYLFISLAFKFEPSISRIYVLLSFVLMVFSLCLWRYAFHHLIKYSSVKDRLRQKIVMVGWSEEAAKLTKAVQIDPHHPYEIVGYIQTGRGNEEVPLPRLGSWDSLEACLRQNRAEIVLLADTDTGGAHVQELIEYAIRYHAEFKMISSFFPLFTSGLRVQNLSGVPLLGIEELPIERWYNRIAKRMVDVVGASIGLIFTAPIMLFFCARVWWESPGASVFYRQQRSGRHGESFEMIKIRSMRPDAEKDGVGWSSKGDPRRLNIGAFMRRWNIDELPQFWNVLRGDMSLVGPRPERPELIDQFKYKIRLYNARHGVKPGMTGWAQIHGWRGDTDLEERIQHDMYYMERWSIWLDIYIMIFTLFYYRNAE